MAAINFDSQAVKKQACISLLSLAFYQAYALLHHIS